MRSCASPSARSSSWRSWSGSLAAFRRCRLQIAARGPVEDEQQLLLYARDLRHLLEIERGQRVLLQNAYKQTVAALASALESKDTGTRAHSQRVQRYALELSRSLSPGLIDDPSAEYGFLLHDVGKIGIPDRILQKPGPLNEGEARLMRTHTLLGEQMLGGVAFLQGEGLGSCAPITSAGTGAGIRTAWRRPRSRSQRASSPLRTRSTQ